MTFLISFLLGAVIGSVTMHKILVYRRKKRAAVKPWSVTINLQNMDSNASVSAVLTDWSNQISSAADNINLENLKKDLDEALSNEDYHKAAELRDKLNTKKT